MKKISLILIFLTCLVSFTWVNAYVQVSDLYVKKEVEIPEDGFFRGDTVVYTIKYRNNGPDDATNVTFQDFYGEAQDQGLIEFTLPDFCSDSGEVITCVIASLPAGIDQSFSYSAKLSYGADLVSFHSSITVYSDQEDYDERDNISTIRFPVKEKSRNRNRVERKHVISLVEGSLAKESTQPDAFIVDPQTIHIENMTYGPEYSEENKDTNISSEADSSSEAPDAMTITVNPFAQKESLETDSEYLYGPEPSENSGTGPEVWMLVVFSIVFAGGLRLLNKKVVQ